MGNKASCKKTSKSVTNLEKGEKQEKNKNQKQVKVNKNRKIVQGNDALYKVIFDPDGFSAHDLALVGQKHSANGMFDKSLKSKDKGRVDVIQDLSEILKKEKAEDLKRSEQISGPLRIVNILDYIDDLYLQLLNLDRNVINETGK